MKKTCSLVLAAVLLAGCTTGTSVRSAGATASASPIASESSTSNIEEQTTDIVVVGSGGAGLSAALTALQQGKKVVVLEKQGIIGGATLMAGGGTVATGSKMEAHSGFEDSPEKLKEDMLANGHNNNYEPTLDIFVNTVGEAIDWLTSEDGGAVAYKASDKPARVFSVDGRGAALISTLSDRIESAGGTILTNTRATELIVENGKVTGVKASGKDKDYIFRADSIILATGGFGHNDDMVPDEYKKFVYAGASGADGDGITMSEAVDANTVNMQYVNTQPNSIVMPTGLGQYCNPGVGGAYATSGAFIVNEEGIRFANEQGSSWDLIQGMKGNLTNYLILDQASFDAFNAGMENSKIYSAEDVDEWLKNNGSTNPVMVKGNTIEDLADTLDIPADALAQTVTDYNEAVDDGTDEFGRNLSMKISESGPYYAIQMWIRYYATLGGLEVNSEMNVLNKSGEPINGLYAAGEVVGGLEGDIYYPGSLFSWAVTSGYDAGKSASK